MGTTPEQRGLGFARSMLAEHRKYGFPIQAAKIKIE